MRILLIATAFLSAGCAVHQPLSQNWRLLSSENHPLLMPPGVTPTKLGYALNVPSGHGKCPPGIRRERRQIRVSVDPESLAKRPAGWLTAWAGGLESQGCIAHAQAPNFAESIPLDPAAGFRLRYADDIEPPARLQVVSPVLLPGDDRELPLETVAASGDSLTVTLKLPPNQIGYETAMYDVEQRPSGGGFSIVPVSAVRNIQGKVEQSAQPIRNFLQFPSDAAFYRLIIKSDQTDFTALVVASPDRAGLDKKDVASCEPNDRMCVAIPRRVAINEVVPVTVNGKEVMVRWGANLAEAIRNSGEMRPENHLSTLTVSKSFRGRPAAVEFDHSSPAILSLLLTGREVISW